MSCVCTWDSFPPVGFLCPTLNMKRLLHLIFYHLSEACFSNKIQNGSRSRFEGRWGTIWELLEGGETIMGICWTRKYYSVKCIVVIYTLLFLITFECGNLCPWTTCCLFQVIICPPLETSWKRLLYYILRFCIASSL